MAVTAALNKQRLNLQPSVGRIPFQRQMHVIFFPGWVFHPSSCHLGVEETLIQDGLNYPFDWAGGRTTEAI